MRINGDELETTKLQQQQKGRTRELEENAQQRFTQLLSSTHAGQTASGALGRRGIGSYDSPSSWVQLAQVWSIGMFPPCRLTTIWLVLS